MAILKFKMEALSYTIPIAITYICNKGIISLLKNMVRLCPSTGNENLVWLMHYRPNFDKVKDSVNGLDFPFDVSETWPLIHYTIIY